MTHVTHRQSYRALASALVFACLTTSNLNAQTSYGSDTPVDFTESYRVREAFEYQNNGETVRYEAGDVMWLRYRDNDSSQVSLVSPRNPERAHAKLDQSSFEQQFERYYHASRVKTELKAENGVVIPSDAVVVEQFFDDHSVWVTVEGDPNGGMYEVPKREYMRQVESLNRAGMTEIPAEYQEVYELLTPFLDAHAADNSGRRVDLNEKGLKVEAIEDGRGAYSWAKKIRVLSGTHKGKEFYVSAKQLENEENSRWFGKNSDPGISYAESETPKPEKEATPPAAPKGPAPKKQEFKPVIPNKTNNGKAATEHSQPEVPQPSVKLSNLPANALRRSKPTDAKTEDHGKAPIETGNVDHFETEDFLHGIKILPSTVPGQCDAIKRSDYRGVHSHEKRSPYHDAIIKAVNSVDGAIHPAILEASIHLETDFRPGLENEPEKKAAIKKYGSYKEAQAKRMAQDHDEWGKGLCQFGPSAASDYGLKWDAEKPTDFSPAGLARYNKENPNSVWNTEACLKAKARYMVNYMNRDELAITLDNGEKYNLKKYLFERGPEHAARAFLSFFNRGSRYLNSLQAYYSRYNALPENYGQAWSARVCSDKSKCKPPQSSNRLMLHTQHINRRHVLNGAGLCGKASDRSFFGRYSKNYTKNSETGKWSTK